MFSIYIDNTRLDLYGNENISLKSSVTSISDISKNLTDFTQDFTVPASDNNNAIFKHYYNATIDNTFDARTKKPARIERDGMPFRYGKITLEKVSVKSGNPSSYTIRFFGNTINLKDKTKNDELSDLDFSAYDHEFNSTNVKQGLVNGLFDKDIIYPMIARKQYYYNSNGADPTLTTTLANIAFNNGGQAGMLWFDLRPAIKLLPIIEAIEAKYNIVFTRDFFGRAEFTNLYMWLNNTSTKGVYTETKLADFTAGDTNFINLGTDIGTFITYKTTPIIYNYYRLYFSISPLAGYEDINYTVRTYKRTQFVDTDYVLINEVSFTGANNLAMLQLESTQFGASQQHDVYWTIQSDEPFAYAFNVTQQEIDFDFNNNPSATTTTYNTGGGDLLNATIDISAQMPKMKVIDFLSGLFKMFKLVVYAQDDDSIYINDYNSYYASGITRDVTRYIDFESVDVERGKLLNPINFNFQEPQTLLNTQFEANTGEAYGDEELLLEDEEGNKLDGESYDIKLPFEQIVYERLVDLNDDLKTNIMYGGCFDEDIEGVSPKPHIFYGVRQLLGTKKIAFINDLNVKEQITSYIHIPSHTLGFTLPQFSTVFGQELNEWDGNLIVKTLYRNYYQEYVQSVFNIKKRVFKYRCKNLPLVDMLNLKLNDVLKIQYDYYRIDSFTTNLLTGDVDLTLVNSFDNGTGFFKANITDLIVNYEARTESIYVTNADNFSFNQTPEGFLWTKVEIDGNNVSFLINENFDPVERYQEIEFEDLTTAQTFTVTIKQFGDRPVTADVNLVTADTTLITADNYI